MVTIKNYIPVLRWKKAERDALASLDVKIRENVTPLFELIMPAPKRDKGDYNKILSDSKVVLQNNLPSTVEELNKCCPVDSSAFVDVHLIDGELRAATLKQILDDSLASAHATLIPVTHIIPVVSTGADTATRKVAVNYASSSDNGLCIRIDRYNLDDEDLSQVINNFVTQNKLDISKTDLLIDLGVISESDDARRVSSQFAKLPSLNHWRTVILSGGAFPKDLSDFEAFSDHDIPRLEWQLWSDLQKNLEPTRKPIFSDYTIQHPVYYGQTPGAIPSASIRYTLEDNWKLMRGMALNSPKSVGFDQYPEQAKLLVNASGIFKGQGYSRGDDYVFEKSQANPKGTGNPMTWLRAGINHHLTLTAKQIATSDESVETDEQ